MKEKLLMSKPEHVFQIGKAQFTCPSWFSSEAKKLLKRILDPNPLTVSSELKSFLIFTCSTCL